LDGVGFAIVIMGHNYNNYAVGICLAEMLDCQFINAYYTQFAAGAILASVPIIFYLSSCKSIM
jgi:ABC-type maltose transport system permease subunit